MDIKWKNKYAYSIIFIISVYLFGIAVLTAFDVTKNKGFIQSEPYFKSYLFKGELLEYFESVQLLNNGFKENLKNNNIDSKVDSYYDRVKSYVDSKESLRYYVKNKKSGKIYTNIKNLDNIQDYLKKNALHVEKFPRTSDNEHELDNINYWFRRNNFEGSFIFIKTKDGFSQMEKDYKYYNSIKERVIKEIILGAAALVLAISLLVFLSLKLKDENNYVKIERWYEKIPLDSKILIFILFNVIMSTYLDNVNFFDIHINIGQFIILTITAVYSLYIIINIDFLLRLIRYKQILLEQFNKSTIGQIILLTRECKFTLIKEISLGISNILFGIFLIIGIIGVSYGNKFILIFSLIYEMIYLMIVPTHILKRVSALNKIIKGTDAIVSGNLDYSIEETGDSNFIKICKNINNMKESFKKSVESQVKSEKLKTELITNVSHDLKTPLTSIINYVGLLKKDDISEKDREKYIGILEQKSERLKVLIEDLFEASKVSSGDIELNIQKIDIVSLLRQSLAEFDNKIVNSCLTFRINMPAKPIYLNLDGKRTWRVFENLISNTLKYSQPNSRVYIDLFEQYDKVIITVKNMSFYEMNFDVNEIFERLKRGDRARSTEGSGLGLSIAKSIVELQGGQIKIDIDGDLFKVTIEFKK